MKIAHFCADLRQEHQPNIKRIIESQGFFYTRIAIAENQIDQLTNDYFDAIIIDGNRMALFDFMTILKGLKLEERIVPPFIVLTDQGDFELQAMYFDLGAMGFMSYDAFDTMRFTTYLYALKRDRETMLTLRSYRIAVVDDSKLSLAVIKDYFLRLNVANVDYYQSSSDFITSEIVYQLVILDLVMPEYSGEDLIYHIKAKHYSTIVLLMSAYGDSPVINHCLQIGAEDFIIKPLDYRLFTLRLVNAIGNHVLTQENIQMNLKLYEMATRDGLTGLFNRSYFIEYIDHRLAELNRKSEEFSALLIDIDHFKSVNDDFGHLKGDEVLKSISKCLNEAIRESDVLCRWGGEEFVVLLPNTSIAHAALVAEKLRGRVEKSVLSLGKPLTISIGATNFQHSDNRDSMFKRLDNSLYLAKLTGRNKVVIDEELQIIRSGLPVSIEWGPFFRSGHLEVDKDHEALITLSNEIIINCFKENNTDQIHALFQRFIHETKVHFDNEESILEHFEYEKLADHKQVHKDLLKRTQHLYNGLLDNTISPVNLAKHLVQEVVVGHIVKSDFEFYDTLREIG